jgi:hypothetical protein
MKIRWLDGQIYLRESRTRIPFRYGAACMTTCPQAILRVELEIGGRQVEGYSGDCLPPSWFDKDPQKDFRQQVHEMLDSIRIACRRFAEVSVSESPFFDSWLDVYQGQHDQGASLGWPALLSSFGVSMVERAILDAICRHCELPFATALRENVFGLVPGRVHPSLESLAPRDWLPVTPRTRLYARHTVGLGDPLAESELDDTNDVTATPDDFPRALETYVREYGQRYFKVKVSNQLEHDLDRLSHVAKIVESHRGTDYRVTLDGNEQYREVSELRELMTEIAARPDLANFWANTLLIEQPLARSVALADSLAPEITALCEQKPIIIDESDGRLDDFSRAVEVGYRGVSTKNCKGPLKSIFNRGLIWKLNQSSPHPYVMTAEDLCCVGVVSLQADLCLVAALGIDHVERNGHHYHRGLSYLPPREQAAALSAHPDLYGQVGEVVAPRLVNGQFEIDSLQCTGFGFAALPDVTQMVPADEWRFG